MRKLCIVACCLVSLWISLPNGMSAVRADEPASVPQLPQPQFVKTWGAKGSEPGQFHFPIGIALTAKDEVVVTDFYNDRVQVFDSEGTLLRHFPVAAHPGGLAVYKSDEIYISHFGIAKQGEERKPDRVTVYTSEGKPLREWGRTGQGDGEFDMPGGVAISADGRVYVADQTNRRVQVFDSTGKFLFKWGAYGTRPGQFGGNVSAASRVGGPQFLAIDAAGHVFTTEASMQRIQEFDAEGKFVQTWSNTADARGGLGGVLPPFNLRGPIGICFDHTDHLWIAAVSGRIQQFSKSGEFLQGTIEPPGEEPGQFQAPHGIVCDRHGGVYVVDAYNHRIQKLSMSK